MPVHKSRVQRSARPRFFGKKAGEKGCLRCDIRGRFRCFGDGCLHPSLASKVPHVLRRSTTDRAATVATDERDNVVEMHESRNDAEGEPRKGFEDFVRPQSHALVRFLRRRNRIEDAEDIAQESLTRLLQKPQKGKEPNKVEEGKKG